MPHTILIADDEAHIRLLIEQSLEDLEEYDSLNIVTANNGAEALEIIETMRPRLVFLDIMMPRMNGFDVCRTAKHGLGLTDTFIILLTAKGQAIDRQQGEEAGADLYLTKPFDPDQLLAIAGAALSR